MREGSKSPGEVGGAEHPPTSADLREGSLHEKMVQGSIPTLIGQGRIQSVTSTAEEEKGRKRREKSIKSTTKGKRREQAKGGRDLLLEPGKLLKSIKTRVDLGTALAEIALKPGSTERKDRSLTVSRLAEATRLLCRNTTLMGQEVKSFRERPYQGSSNREASLTEPRKATSSPGSERTEKAKGKSKKSFSTGN